MVAAKIREKKNTVPPWLSNSRSDWHFYSVVANQHANPNMLKMFYNVGANRCHLFYIFLKKRRGRGGGVTNLLVKRSF